MTNETNAQKETPKPRAFGGMTKSAFGALLDSVGIGAEGTHVLAWTNPVYAAPEIRTPRTHAPAYTLARDNYRANGNLAEAVEIARKCNPDARAEIVEHIASMIEAAR